ncbi:MAG: cell envelope integrity protein TolA [Arenicella sp.]
MSRRKNRVGVFDRAIALTVAVIVFGGFAAFLWTSTQESEEREVVQAFDAKEIATIAASTVTESEIQKQKDKILKKDREKKLKEKQRQEKEKKKLDDLKKKQAKEEQRLKELKAQQEKEKQAIALRKKKAADEEKKRKKKEAADKKRKAAEKKKREAEAAAEQKKQAEADAKQAKADALQAEIDAERKKALAERSARNSTTLRNRYASLIKAKLESNLIAPIGSRPTQVPVVNIQLDDSGNVLSTRIVTSSGDFGYDQAVLAAVGKSSPLPLPKDAPEVRRELQNFDLRVNL